MLKPKAGDLVRLRPMRVEEVVEASVVIKGEVLFWARISDIVEILPPPLLVGDRVSRRGDGVGTVIAVHYDLAWVKWDDIDDAGDVYPFSDLTLLKAKEPSP